ncbi:MAG TPA: hypothetical protein VGK74_00225 [Symbiobacteriaceae bacterium]
MKRILVILAVAVSLMVAVVAVAQAYGPRGGTGGYGVAGGYGYGPGARGNAIGAQGTSGYGYGPGMMGGGRGAGYGPGMMGGGRGAGFGPGQLGSFDNGFGYCGAAGQNFDPAVMATTADAMVTQNKAFLTNLQTLLAAAKDDASKQLLTVRIEWQTIQVNWAEGRLPVVKALPADWLKAEIAMAQYDVDFFTKATAADAGNQAFIASRLAQAQERLAYFQAEAAKAQTKTP